MAHNWPVELYKKSVLKQRKFEEVSTLLGPTDGCRCLDIGGDNGVVSYLLRQRGGSWASADLDEQTVSAIRALVGEDVHRIGARSTPFADDEFDRVAIVDFLEHVEEDRAFVEELYRIMKPGGELIINVPHDRGGLLRRLRLALGETDEKHGHVRPGYTMEGLEALLGGCFTVSTYHTYSRFFSELIDMLLRSGVSLVKGQGDGGSAGGQKGQVVTGADLSANRTLFRLYSLIYPVVWAFSRLDGLLASSSGYMLIAKATVKK